MKLLGIAIVTLAAGLHAAPSGETAAQLMNAGAAQVADGKLAEARATFESLVALYPHDPLAVDAKGSIDAMSLYEEGQSRAQSGKYDTARVAFETLIAVYPESPLAARAKSGIAAIDEKERVSHPVLRSVEYRDLDAIPVDEIRAQMDAREVRLSVGQPCRSKDVKQAKLALEEILAEKGMGRVKVEAHTRTVSPHAVAVIFKVEKAHAWFWRTRTAGLGE